MKSENEMAPGSASSAALENSGQGENSTKDASTKDAPAQEVDSVSEDDIDDLSDDDYRVVIEAGSPRLTVEQFKQVTKTKKQRGASSGSESHTGILKQLRRQKLDFPLKARKFLHSQPWEAYTSYSDHSRQITYECNSGKVAQSNLGIVTVPAPGAL